MTVVPKEGCYATMAPVLMEKHSMYVCAGIYTLCIYVCGHMHVCMCAGICMCVCMWTHLHVYMYIGGHMHVYVCV